MRIRRRAWLVNGAMLVALQIADALAAWWLLPDPSGRFTLLFATMALALGLALAAAAALRPPPEPAGATPPPPGDFGHELRTALNSIIGFAELIEAQLLGPVGTPKYCDYARYIRESGGNLLGLVEPGHAPHAEHPAASGDGAADGAAAICA
jgi:signal transduction histidine kinase